MRPILILLAAFLLAAPAFADEPIPDTPADDGMVRGWAYAEFGEPLYDESMTHWPYANPDAPKGGAIVMGAYGTFDSLNTYILKGTWPAGIGLISDSLMTGSGDELSSLYGLIARDFVYPDDKSWIIFHLRSEARWNDGAPITALDFKYAFDVIKEHGRPFLRAFYEDVTNCEVIDAHTVKYSFRTRGNMKPLIVVGGSSPLPRHFWYSRDITKTTLEPILGSGPYRIAQVDQGRSITYKRVPGYWARNLNVNRGLHNFDTIRYDYYQDETVQFEAFKAGEIDFREENRAQRWAMGYDLPDIGTKIMVKREVADETPQGIQAWFFNTRRAPFDNIHVREAITTLFDFESVQRTLLYGQYKRTKSFFPNSDFGSGGKKPGGLDVTMLLPFADKLPARLFTTDFTPPTTEGQGLTRANLRRAIGLFAKAGWILREGELRHRLTGDRMKLEILLVSPSFERLTEPFVQNLQKAGIDASMRRVDTAQFQRRVDEYDYDLVSLRSNFFPPPGPELRSYYGSGEADTLGGANWTGVKDTVVDTLIEKVISAPDLATLKSASRALDRVLLWGHYVVPQWYNDCHRIAYWNRFAHPDLFPKYSVGFPGLWWLDAAKDARVKAAR